MVFTPIVGVACRPAARGLALVFTLLCFGTLVASVQGKPVYNEKLQELRKRHSKEKLVTISNKDQGHKDIHGATAPGPSSNSFNGASNTTLPFTLRELGLEKTSDEYHRRLLQNVVSSVTPKCTIKRNVTLHGGHLPYGPKRIKDIPNPAACCARCSFLEGCEAWAWSRVLKMCYPRAAEGWRSVSSKDHVSGFIKRIKPPPSPPPPKQKVTKPPTSSASSSSNHFSPVSGNLFWQGKLTAGDHQLKRGFAGEVKTVNKANNKVVILDPTGLSNDTVIKTSYKKGCWSPKQACGGGALFYAWPEKRESSIGEAARLEYEVYFPTDFTWKKGGKLPGFLGGDIGCSGGADAGKKHCWSVRMMWRADGQGEAYLYVDDRLQASDFCDAPTVCDPRAGTSFLRGAFTFKRGEWNRIALTVRMNDIGTKNGLLQVDVDGETKILYEKVVYRTAAKPDLDIAGLVFATWFGGSDKTWAPDTKQEAYWKNFKIYKLD
ncbi:hypothetical protein NADE_008524 [Nannochloris sp. 'desiccata']|nr:hypothetical protein NADE_008524 [Chlorella desiccata (nom. nud.)]